MPFECRQEQPDVVAEIKTRLDYHKALIGHNGSRVNQLRKNFGVSVKFSDDSESIVIHGKVDCVQKAKDQLENWIKDLVCFVKHFQETK